MSYGYPDSVRSNYGGANPYGANYGGSNTALNVNPYGDDAQEQGTAEARGPPVFRARDRRQGAYGQVGPPSAPTSQYGGFTRSRNNVDELGEDGGPQVNRPTSLERSQAKRRSGGKSFAQRSPTRPRAGGAGAGAGAGYQEEDGVKQIEDVLAIIQEHWNFMMDEKCVPVQVALQLMDNSSLGMASRYPEFKAIHQQLQNALKAIVNEHHQGFNSSIGTFHAIQTSIQTSLQMLRELREKLLSAKTALSSTKPELKSLAQKSREYDEALQTLNQIENIQAIPEKVEARISDKRFITAVELLQDGLRLIRQPKMEEIGALRDLRVRLSNLEQTVVDILIEELHSHLYLKSPYCESRSKQHANQYSKGIAPRSGNTATDVRGRKLHEYLEKLESESSAMQDDTTRIPEANSFDYIQLLVESLNSLGVLEVAVDTITQRLPVELFKVVEKTSKDIDKQSLGKLRRKEDQDTMNFTNPAKVALLEELLGTLYAKFEAIAEGHRVVHEVIAGILKREGLRTSSSLTSGFRELWKLFQSEIRSLLHDYLTTNSNNSSRQGQAGDRTGNVFSRTQRDKTKQIFKLSNMDPKSTDMASEREDLDLILKSSVPGLVSDTKRSDITNLNSSTTTVDGGATGHKLLVEPNVFNMGALLPPSLIFLNRLREIVPPTSDIALSTLTSFLDDFLVNVFLPLLDEALEEQCARIFIEADAFQQDPQWSSHSEKPIFKGTYQFLRLIVAFCEMLDILPHDQAFSQLIINQLVIYYDKCCGWYKAKVSRAQPHPRTGGRQKMSAALIEGGEIRDIVSAIMQSDEAIVPELLRKEAALLIRSSDAIHIEEMDIVSDKKNIAALCLLATSMRWLAGKFKRLGKVTPEATKSSRRESSGKSQDHRWTLVTGAEKQSKTLKIYLPLSDESKVAYDGLVTSFQELATNALRMLHVEIRCHVIYHVTRSMARTFLLNQEHNDPDPEVLALNTDILDFDEEAGDYLEDQQRGFIMNGLSTLLDDLLLHFAPKIPIMNKNGCGRLQLNILVLQQNLKNVEPTASLPRSALYYGLCASGPEAIVAEARAKGKDIGFTYEEMKTLMELSYSETLQSERREVAVQAKRGLDENVLALSEYIW
ncbi:hypothetical protein EJ08DRAFT_738247 [Tothia fuscella]|uniref:Exocyst complex component Sec8 n=1 Tax=Tothia fuscella TaxID=1048955 RepID=A0A9P4NH22_9PEZI|nr:hypothetical protein EJ08DRAFT_738247 [Tothia fuscella]